MARRVEAKGALFSPRRRWVARVLSQMDRQAFYGKTRTMLLSS